MLYSQQFVVWLLVPAENQPQNPPIFFLLKREKSWKKSFFSVIRFAAEEKTELIKLTTATGQELWTSSSTEQGCQAAELKITKSKL